MATAIEKQACLPQFSVLLLNNFLAFANILPVRRSCKLGNFTGPPIFLPVMTVGPAEFGLDW